MGFLNKLKIEQPHDPLLGIYLKLLVYYRDTYTPMLITVLFAIAQIRNQSRCPLIDE
jgi:hypothetical protein